MSKIFISYRRDDSQWQTKAIYERLSEEVESPRNDIFFDLDSMTVGLNFHTQIQQSVDQCGVLIAIIGMKWTSATDDATGARRLDDPTDFVRLEVAAALRRDIPVIPVLLDGAPVPKHGELPDDIKELSNRHGIKIRADSFDHDVGVLIKSLKHIGVLEGRAEPKMDEETLKLMWLKVEHSENVSSLEAFLQQTKGTSLERTVAAKLRDVKLQQAQAPAQTRVNSQADKAEPVAKRSLHLIALILPLLLAACVGVWAFKAGIISFPQSETPVENSAQAETISEPFADLIDPGVPGSAPDFSSIEEKVVSKEHQAPAMFMTSAEPEEYAVGQSFTDCSGCPEMVVVPAGSFKMGSPSSESDRYDEEGLQRNVRIGYKFAVGKYEVTWAQWEACVSAGGCDGSGPTGAGGDEDWGKGSRPVINVSWDDAKAYAKWLSRKTGENYRLLSEAEWEYAARAGTTGRFSNNGSESDLCRVANGADASTDYSWRNKSCNDGYGMKTAPVGSFSTNAFGVFDMHGNVWEWVEDWYKSGYSHAPSDGGSFSNCSDCSRRVVRGGSWIDRPRVLRSANRDGDSPSDRDDRMGFRLARDISE